MTSETKTSTSIGMASISIEYGSVEGVATAANTKVPTMIQGRCRPARLPETTPARLSMTTNSGISKATPKTSSIRVMKVKNRRTRSAGSTPSGVKPISAAMPFGST